MRIGIVVLPELDWDLDRERWRRAEEYGFDHAWIYDHLAWRNLADDTWHATVPTLVAAALATSRIRLGTLVTTPNFRHPVPLAKELMTLDVMSHGRLTVALGAGAPGYDAAVLGGPPLSASDRQARFEEFYVLLDQLLWRAEVTWTGKWYDAVEARMHPGPAQRPRPPLLVAANGPQGMRLAATAARVAGDGWVTIGPRNSETPHSRWWASVASSVRMMDDANAHVEAQRGQALTPFTRLLYLGSRTSNMTSLDQVRDHIGRAVALGFTDVALAWPRPTRPFQGNERVLDTIAEALPELRAQER